MSLEAGTHLGPYQILSLLGAGGMGEVYKARDTRLDRIVAIKVLPSHLTSNPDLKDRFEREARTVASLNHPHICILHDIGHQDGVDYLVMEYLEGETLQQRLSKGALPIEEALRYAIQIADALDKAQNQGIIHRDLKPGNIMLANSGAKLLDFGLAKLKGLEAVAGALSTLPTQQASLTAAGTILGTFQYMAPEQLEGKEADARTDIFAFGAVLYEMVTGKKAFEGNSQASLISSIMSADPPPMARLQPMSPPALEHVVRTCLAKRPEDRWQTAHDVMVELRWIAEAGSQAGVAVPVVSRRTSRERLLLIATAISVLIAVLSLLAVARVSGFFGARPTDVGAVRFSMQLPENMLFAPGPANPHLAVSADGRKIAFAALNSSRKRYLWVRSLNSFSAQRLEGTEGASLPFWSPDGEYVGFFADGKLKKIPFSGGSPQILCDAPQPRGGTWSREGVIVFSPVFNGVLHRVPDTGGLATPLGRLGQAQQQSSHVKEYQSHPGAWPQFLPESRRFIYLDQSGKQENNGIYMGSLDSDERKLLLQTRMRALVAPPDYLLFVREGMLMAQRFDLNSGQPEREPRSVAESVAYREWGATTSYGAWGATAFSVSENGVLVYRAGEAASLSRLIWYTRDGKSTPVNVDPGVYVQVTLSPDEKRVGTHRYDPRLRNEDIWALELSSGILSRLTIDPGADTDPVWAPEGRRIAFTSMRGGTKRLFVKDLMSGQEDLLPDEAFVHGVDDWTNDGRFVVYRKGTAVCTVSMEGSKKPELRVDTPYSEDQCQVSPDGRWIAYNADESGSWEVYVAAFPTFSQKRQVSSGGGVQPLWRKDGKELFYLNPEGKVMVVTVSPGAELETGPPKVLFATNLQVTSQLCQYAVTGDGQRFLFVEPVAQQSGDSFNVILNWPAILSQLGR